MTNAKEVTLFKCSQCGSFYYQKSIADICCQERKCEDCGGELDIPHYAICSSCRDKRIEQKIIEEFNNAKHVKYSDYEGDLIFSDQTESYYSDPFELIDDIVEYNYDGEGTPDKSLYVFPEIGVWGTREYTHGLNPDLLVDELEEDELAPEDFRLCDEGVEEIKKFCEEFNNKYGNTVYLPDYDIAIIGDETTKYE